MSRKSNGGSPILVAENSGANGFPSRNLLKDQAYSALKDRILRGDLEPGTFLSERQIAGWLAMSKTPIRAALEKLEAEGFVTTSPQQGIVVRALSVHEIADQFEIRLALETFVARAVSGRLTDEQISRLEANLKAQKACLRQMNVQDSVRLDTEFHILFCRFLGNQEILKVMEQSRERIHRVILRVHEYNPARLKAGYAEHCAIADAVMCGDAELAVRRVQEHLEIGKQNLLSPRRG